MLIISLFPSELCSNPEKQHKCAKPFHPGESDWIFPVSTQAPRPTLSSRLPARIGALISPVLHCCFPLGWTFILHFLCLFFPQHRPFQRAVTQRSLSAAQPPAAAEGGRRDQPCQLRRFQASTGPCRLPPAPKYNPNWEQAGLTDCACSPWASWPLKTRPYHLFARKQNLRGWGCTLPPVARGLAAACKRQLPAQSRQQRSRSRSGGAGTVPFSVQCVKMCTLIKSDGVIWSKRNTNTQEGSKVPEFYA